MIDFLRLDTEDQGIMFVRADRVIAMGPATLPGDPSPVTKIALQIGSDHMMETTVKGDVEEIAAALESGFPGGCRLWRIN